MEPRDDRSLERLSVRVAELCDELGSSSAGHWLPTARELLAVNEPNEALLQLAWGIAEEQILVSEEMRTFIETAVADPLDLPVDVTGQQRPVRSRRGTQA
ncbi:hypothetical protein [Jatrophihabitans fulvus]